MKKINNLIIMEGTCLYIIGLIYIKLNKIDLAIKYLEIVMFVSRKENKFLDYFKIIYCSRLLFKIFFKGDKFNLSVEKVKTN